MNIIYIANARIPTEKAHGLQIMKNCESFVEAGAEVTLLVPNRRNQITKDPFAYYGIEPRFKIQYLSVIPLIRPNFTLWGGFFIESFSFVFSVRQWIKKYREQDTIIYGRDPLALFFVSFLGLPMFLEVHDTPRRLFWFWQWLSRRLTGIVSTNQWKARFFQEKFGVPSEKILVAPNGFDRHAFENLPSREECRKVLQLPHDKKIVLYVGHLYEWKGSSILLQAARHAQEKSRHISRFKSRYFVFVGGTKKDVFEFQKKAGGLGNILFTGHKSYQELHLWLQAADVLVLPNSAKSEESVHATSPIKLFEYMASGRPIVSSDLPSIREVVSEKEVYFVNPDDPEALLAGVEKVLTDGALQNTLSQNAKAKSQNYTWEKRANHIFVFVRSL